MPRINGIGAVCTVLKRFLHSRPDIVNKYPNSVFSDCLNNLLAIRKEKKTVNRKEQWCIIFRHDDFPNKEIYCVERYCKVLKEGPTGQFFALDNADLAPTIAEEEPETGLIETPTTIPGGNVNDDIVRIRMQGLEVDDDNDPAPENIPTATNIPSDSPFTGWTGSTNGFDNRRSNNHKYKGPRMISPRISNSKLTFSLTFLLCYYIKTVLIVETNKTLEGHALTFGEFLVFLGLWYLMATVSGCNCKQFFSSQPVNIFLVHPSD